MNMENFLKLFFKIYRNLFKRKIKEFTTPYMPKGNLNRSDWEIRGILAENMNRILIKIPWVARLCKPNFMKIIGDLTKRFRI